MKHIFIFVLTAVAAMLPPGILAADDLSPFGIGSCHVNYPEQVIKATAKDHVDFVTLHPYEFLNGVTDNVDTEPIEITAVVRRNESNDGFKTVGGWYTVPDKKKWHTVKWKIDDAHFASYRGHNFSLVPDGDVYNKYSIQRVTVTKTGR